MGNTPYNPITIQYDETIQYPGTAQANYVGAQNQPGRRGWWSGFSDSANPCISSISDGVRYLYYLQENSGSSTIELKALDILLNTVFPIASFALFSGPLAGGVFCDTNYVYVAGSFTAVIPQGGSPVTMYSLARFSISSSYATWTLDETFLFSPSNGSGNGLITGNPSPANAASQIIYFSSDGGDGSGGYIVAVSSAGIGTPFYQPTGTGKFTAMTWLENSTTNAGASLLCGYAESASWFLSEYILSNNTLSAWAPTINGQVNAITPNISSGIIYLGGSFTTCLSTTRNGAASVNYAGTLQSWNPAVETSGSGAGTINCIALSSNHVWLGGSFYQVNSAAASSSYRTSPNIAKVDPVTGLTDASFLSILASGAGTVQTLTLFDRTVYAGGAYTTFQTANQIAPIPNYLPPPPGGVYQNYLNAFPDYGALIGTFNFLPVSASLVSGYTHADLGEAVLAAQGFFYIAGIAGMVVVLDSSIYQCNTYYNIAITLPNIQVIAADGCAPTIQIVLGATTGTYGARTSGRVIKASTLGEYIFVSKSGNDSTGIRGNSSFPFLTITGALGASGRVNLDTVEILDSGIYVEDINGGSLSVNIQASMGQVPTLTNVSTSGQHFTMSGGSGLYLFGLNISELKNGTAYVAAGNFSLQGNDCTFSGALGSNGFNLAGSNAAGGMGFYNCIFSGMTPFVGWDAELYIENCFFANCYKPIEMSATMTSLVVLNSTFSNIYLNAILNSLKISTGSTTINNCLFDGITTDNVPVVVSQITSTGSGNGPWGGNIVSTPPSIGGYAIAIIGGGTQTGSITNCYFTNCGRGSVLISASNYTISNCIGYHNGISQGPLGIWFYLEKWNNNTNAFFGKVSISNPNNFAYFNIEGTGIVLSQFPTADFCLALPYDPNSITMSGLIIENCGSIGMTGTGFGIYSLANNNGKLNATIENCTSLGSTNSGFNISNGMTDEVNGSGIAITTFNIIGIFYATIMGDGIPVFTLNPTTCVGYPIIQTNVLNITMSNLVESNSGSAPLTNVDGSAFGFHYVSAYNVPNPSTTPSYQAGNGYYPSAVATNCVIGSGTNYLFSTTFNTGAFIQRSPQLASTASGVEDLSLLPSSPAFMINGATNGGYDNPMISITAGGCIIEGITFLSPQTNMYSGIYEASGLTNGSIIKYCTFSNVTFVQKIEQPYAISYYGIFKNSSGEVSSCLFQNNGNGIILGAGATVKRNVFDEVSCAGIANAGFGASLTNNSSYACAYGQYDIGIALLQQNNIYSESAVYDYFGVSYQYFSDIALLSSSALIDPNSIQNNPLFNNAVNGDLRLQSLVTSNYFQSPAIGEGADGYDMGAFKFLYGIPVSVWQSFTFGTPYRNPDKVERIIEPVNLSEGFNEDGSTYSQVSAFQLRYDMTWNENANDMPIAQTNALIAIYKTPDGIITIDLGDGAGPQAAYVLRKTQLEYTDMTGGYSMDGIPLVVKALSVRIS